MNCTLPTYKNIIILLLWFGPSVKIWLIIYLQTQPNDVKIMYNHVTAIYIFKVIIEQTPTENIVIIN